MNMPILLCAQRIEHPHQARAIHVYEYDLLEIPSDPLVPLQEHFEKRSLTRKHIVFAEGGNQVLSSLDVVTPDRAAFLRELHRMIGDEHLGGSCTLPFHWRNGPVGLCFQVGSRSLEHWPHEFKELARHILLP